MKYNKLTSEEERVIVNKGTERPNTGKYNKFYEAGTYSCKRCDVTLYTSSAKFDSGSGWPAFDDDIDGTVKKITDADGSRTEILCDNCSAHLGHVFFGEGFTKTNARHCVNSISLNFVAENQAEGESKTVTNEETAIFAGGCFWGVEYFFQDLKGVISTSVGYTGGETDNPTYKEICYKDTGHAEALEVVFNPAVVSYTDLAKIFFEIHDPTQVDRQGPDRGKQYRSAVFYTNDSQKQLTEELIEILKQKGLKVATQLVPSEKFWDAEDYHQKYYEKTGKEPYCHSRVKRF